MLKPEVDSFCIQKAGESESDCQDSVYPEPGTNGGRVFAVADGTTQSFYSGCWARTLTRYFAEHPEGAFKNWESWLSDPRDAWRKGLAARIDEAPEDIYLRNGFNERQPAASTFVGLQLLESGTEDIVPWEALVLGDSCLFHLRAGGKVICYFRKSSGDFTFFTESAQSYATKSPNWPTPISSSNGGTAANKGDAFLLATDAFSKWMLGRQESGQPVWGAVAQMKNQAELNGLVLAARRDARAALENDDVAVVAVRLGPLDPAFTVQRYVPNPPVPPSVRVQPVPVNEPVEKVSAPERETLQTPAGSGPPRLVTAAKKASETPQKLPKTEMRQPTQPLYGPGRMTGGRLSVSYKSLLIIALILALSFLANLVFFMLYQGSERTNQSLVKENESLAKAQQLRAKDAELRLLHKLVDKLSANAPLLSKELEQLDQKSKTLHNLIDQLYSSGPQLSKELDQFDQQSQRVRELIATFQTSTENAGAPREAKTPMNTDFGNGGQNNQ